jgi:hypothetical protein
MAAKIHTIVTHHRPHFDEIVAIFLLKQYCAKQFPGIRTAKIVFADAGSGPAHGHTADEWEEHGVVYIGVGHGRFDEHPTPDHPRRVDDSASSLVSKAFNLKRNYETRDLVSYATTHDTQSGTSKYMLAATVNALHEAHEAEVNPMYAFDIITKIIDAQIQQDRDFFYRSQAPMKQMGEILKSVDLAEVAKSLKIAVISTNNTQAWRYAQGSRGGRYLVVICRRPVSGTLAIFANKRSGFDLTSLISALRREENKAQQREIDIPDDWLTREGTIPEVPEWFIFPPIGLIANGTLTTRDTPHTVLSIDRITELVIEYLRPQIEPLLEDQRSQDQSKLVEGNGATTTSV